MNDKVEYEYFIAMYRKNLQWHDNLDEQGRPILKGNAYAAWDDADELLAKDGVTAVQVKKWK